MALKIISSLRRLSCSVRCHRSHFCVNFLSKYRGFCRFTHTFGIVSHVDAGKTTLTEAILYLCGTTQSLGSVNKGTTVTDYLAIEKQRGITVNSVSVSFEWPHDSSSLSSSSTRDTTFKTYKVNLIDTPGHAEFQFEVQRSLAALDSVIIVIDGTRGVQAQTYAYFVECRRRNLPIIFFINKKDLNNFDLESSMTNLEQKLKADCFLIEKNNFGDLFEEAISKQNIKYDDMDAAQDHFKKDPNILKNFIEMLAIIDPNFETQFSDLSHENRDKILESAKNLFRAGLWFPVIEGSAKKLNNIEFLMDIFLYLSFDECHKTITSNKSSEYQDSIALLFKNQHISNSSQVFDYFKAFQGSFESKKTYYLYDSEIKSAHNKCQTITIDKLLFNKGTKNLVEEQKAIQGQVFAICDPCFTSKSDENKLWKCNARQPARTGSYLISRWPPDQKLLTRIRNFPLIKVPSPIFFMNVEPFKAKDRITLLNALKEIALSDPSLDVTEEDNYNSNICIGAQGKIHIDVLMAKLKEFYGIEASIRHRRRHVFRTIVKSSSKFDEEELLSNSNYSSRLAISIQPSKNCNYLSRITIPDHLRENALSFGSKNVNSKINNDIPTMLDDEMIKSIAISLRSFEIKNRVENTAILIESLPIWPDAIKNSHSVKLYHLSKIIGNLLDLILDRCGHEILRFEEMASKATIEIQDSSLINVILKELTIMDFQILEVSESSIIKKGKQIIIRGPSINFFHLPSKLSDLTHGFFNMNLEQDGRIEIFNYNDEDLYCKKQSKS